VELWQALIPVFGIVIAAIRWVLLTRNPERKGMTFYRSAIRFAMSKLDRDMMLSALEIDPASPTAIKDALALISELRSHQQFAASSLRGDTESADGHHNDQTPPP